MCGADWYWGDGKMPIFVLKSDTGGHSIKLLPYKKNPESHTSVASLSAQKIVISKFKALVLFSIHDSEQTLFMY